MEIGSTHTQSYPVSSSLLNGMDTAAPGVTKAGGRTYTSVASASDRRIPLAKEALLLSHSPLPSHIGLRRRVYHEKPAELPAESAEAYLPDDIELPEGPEESPRSRRKARTSESGIPQEGFFLSPSHALNVGCETPSILAAAVSVILFCFLANLYRRAVKIPPSAYCEASQRALSVILCPYGH